MNKVSILIAIACRQYLQQVGMQIKMQDPETFQYATVVTKDSKTGLSSNRRLLVVRGGHLYYYSTVPKSFDGDPKVLDYFHELPKSSIEIIKIKKITSPSKTSPTFEIYFNSKNIMQRQDIRKTLTNQAYEFQPKKDAGELIWKFTCDNHFIKQKWISILVQLMNHFNSEEENIKKYFQSIGSPEERKSYMPKNNGKNPWRESVADRKQYCDLKNFIEIQEKAQEQPKTQENFSSVMMKKNVKQHVAC